MSGTTKQTEHIEFTVNGEAAKVVYAHKTLLEVFREDCWALV
jgi:hypothetical protein